MEVGSSINNALSKYKTKKRYDIHKEKGMLPTDENGQSSKGPDALNLIDRLIGGLYEGSKAINRFNQRIANWLAQKGWNTNLDLANAKNKSYLSKQKTGI